MVVRGAKILLVRNWLGSQRWTLPGGGLQRGEAVADAARRELAEELGLNVAAKAVKTPGSVVNREDGLRYRVELCAIHLPDVVPAKPNFEILAVEWFDRKLLPENRSPLVDEALTLL